MSLLCRLYVMGASLCSRWSSRLSRWSSWLLRGRFVNEARVRHAAMANCSLHVVLYLHYYHQLAPTVKRGKVHPAYLAAMAQATRQNNSIDMF